MDVVLDTNIFAQDFSMDSKKFEILFDYLNKTKSKVIMPEIVLKEITALYQRRLSECNGKYKDIVKELSRIIRNACPSFPNIIEENVAKYYVKHLKEKLCISDKDVVRNKPSYLDEVVRRATQRIRPCTDTGQEFRDVILWLAVMDIASLAKNNTLAFISNNTKQFSKDQKLHEELLRETKERKVEIKYYNDISEFIREHAARIEFVSEEWLLSEVPLNGINQRVVEELMNDEPMLFRWAELKGKQLTGYVEVLSSDVKLEDYFIYEKADNSLYIQAVYVGEIEVEIEYINEDAYEYYMEEPEYTKIKSYYPTVNITIGITLKDKKVSDVSVVETAID